MTPKTLRVLAMAAAIATMTAAAQAAPAKKMMKPAKMVAVYQAAKCHMYFSAAQAKKYKYACPDSKGKMTKVMVSPAVAKAGVAKTTMMLAPKKKAM